MAEILLVRKEHEPIAESDRDIARRVLFSMIDGLGEVHSKRWRRFIAGLMKLDPGEVAEIRTHRERLGVYHRRHMLLEVRVFESQERFEEFQAFRTWLKVGSGFVDWYPGPKGGVIPVPKSISYSKLGQDEMEQVHADMVAFLRTAHAAKTLWPKMPAAQRATAAETVLGTFGAFGQ